VAVDTYSIHKMMLRAMTTERKFRAVILRKGCDSAELFEFEKQLLHEMALGIEMTCRAALFESP